MLHDRMNRTDVAILFALLDGPLTVTQAAELVGRSAPHVSERLTRLEAMRLVERRRRGNAVRVGLARGGAAADLRLLLAEGGPLDLGKVLTGPGLLLLPLLLPPGSTLGGLGRATGLSAPTVRGRVRLWRGMGLLSVGGPPRRYTLRPELGRLVAFVSSYVRERDQRHLDAIAPAGTIVWHGRGAFLFSSPGEVAAPGVVTAGATRLEELGYDIVRSRRAYLHRPGAAEVTEAEALVQAVLMDPGDPRPARMLRRALSEGQVGVEELMGYASMYGIRDLLGVIAREGGSLDG